jgi:predicted small lipoprotein YifL
MKQTVLRILAAALLLTLTACGGGAYPNPYPNKAASQPTRVPTPSSVDTVPRITLEEAKAAFDAETAVFIDVRGTENYNQVHIAGALDVPYPEIETRLAGYDRDALIITYCT